jgi:hypothetical protein
MSKHEESDPLIDEIRAIRAQISHEHGDDVERLGKHHMEYQKQFADRLISPPPAPKKQDKSAA